MSISMSTVSPPIQNASLEEALRNCASEPIHLIGSIQPSGVLLAVEPDGLFIVRVASKNLFSLFSVDPADAIGKPLQTLVGSDLLEWLKTLVDLKVWTGAHVGVLSLNRNGKVHKHDMQVFMSGGLLVIEVEEEQPYSGDVFQDLFIPIRDALWKLDSENDLTRYAQMTVEQVRLLTGFDRVMMYRFDSNWDGEVIAESKIDSADSYLGNHFPASDIPAQARALYTKNLVRIIADVDAKTIPLLTDVGGGANVQLDLTHSWLRSLSPVHVEYLRNMGVRASLSISLVQNNVLWGLIACHHFSPKYVGLKARDLDEFIARVVSLKLLSMDTAERTLMGGRIRDLLSEMTQLIRSCDDLDSVILLLKDKLLGLVRSTGAVLTIDGTRHLIGDTPPTAVIDSLEESLRIKPPTSVFHTDDLTHQLESDDVTKGVVSHHVNGILIAPLDRQMNNFVMWFRPGILRTLRWAGNPAKSLVRDASGVHISPRKSFQTWVQCYRDKSLPWSQIEVDAAHSLSLALIEVLAQKALKSSEESYRLLAENSTDMIARLDLGGFIKFASPACEDMFGHVSTKITGLWLGDVVEENADELKNLLQALQPLGTTCTRVLRGKRVNRNDLWIEAKFKHTFGTNGEHEILLNARDVTQRHNYQLAIEEVHRRYTKIMGAAGEGLISLNNLGRVVYANEVAARILGRDNDDIVGDICCEAFCRTAVNQDHPDCPFLSTLQDGETRQGIQRLFGDDNMHQVSIRYVCTPLTVDGAISGCVVVFSEVIDQTDNDSESITAVTLDLTQEAVMLTDANCRICSVNRVFTEITGYTQEEAIGKTPRLLKSGVHTPNFYADMWDSMKEKGRWAGEVWNRRKNGEIYPQLVSISAVLDAAGKAANYVAVFSDISKAKQVEDRLFHLANHDTLTGLPNRMNFGEHLAMMLERVKRSGSGAAVIFIDLDRFKMVNDTLGHAAGDKYLSAISNRLSAATRKNDLLGRWGGDEFVLAMQDITDPKLIADVLNRMRLLLAEPIHLGGHELIPTASIGVALYPHDGTKSSELLSAADTAMYRAKKHGRNRIEFYAEDMSKDLDAELTLSSEIHRAFRENQFFLVYQPQIDPQTKRMKGVEALARWRHPVRGVLAPVAFLPTLEEIGLIEDLGLWALNAACQQMKQWSDLGLPVPKVSVNVAPAQLKESFVTVVAEAIAKAGIAPHQLELEITEGALESGELAQRITAQVRELGVLLAVDDFGTGYSSLSHIKRFPISCFKIDKSFIDGVPGSAADVAIVRTILALGASFNVEIVAEGAETLAQVEFLEREGVRNIQGFYFSPPLEPQQILSWKHPAAESD